MFLKRLTVTGFKSFADRVDFDFGPGVTAIVGPNGCGKSNVVDAIKWVLGEQSARSLRGRQMLDMIFSGSSTRRSSSVAQVDLVFDNADRTLALDQEEVTVSRKLYRSGESEYRINNDAARLKDIRELFMDTGVGVDAYSVIEQGKVDSLLQSNPVERRIIFEEAAGISRYKARRREAERKLERTRQNLLRVADIIEELEKRLRSVKLQAGKARNYVQYEQRFNELRSSYAMAEYHRFSEEIERLTREAQQGSDRGTALSAEIDRFEAHDSELTVELDRLAERIHAVDNDLLRARSDRAAHEERVEAARHRVDEQRALLERVDRRRATDGDRFDQSRTELDEVQETVAALEKQTHGLHVRIEELGAQDKALARDLTQAQAILEDEKTGIIDLLRKSAQMHNEVVRLNTQRESLVGQKGRLSERDAVITTELTAQLEHKARLEHRLRDVEALIGEETRRLDEKKAEAVRMEELRRRLDGELAAARQQHSALRSRQELLLDLERKMEGVGAGVRRLLDRKRQADDPDTYAPVVGLVAELFDADVTRSLVVEAVLGDADQHLVVSDSKAFFSRSALYADLPGRLDLLCLDRLAPIVNERDFSDRPGFVARAIDLVRYAEAYASLARHLFGKTVVVQDLDTALHMAAQPDAVGHRFVTLAGELIEPTGKVSLGPPSSHAGLISRKSELKRIEGQRAELGERLEVLEDRLNRAEADVAHLDGVQQELRTAIYEANTAKVEAQTARQPIVDTIERLGREQPVIAQEVAMIEHEINEVLQRSERGGKSLEVLEQENTQREQEVTRHRTRIDDIVMQRRTMLDELTDAKVTAGQLTEKRHAATEVIAALQRTIQELQEAIASTEHDQQQCAARIAEAEQTIRTGTEGLTALDSRIERLDAATGNLRRQRDMLRLDVEKLGESIKSTRRRLAEVEGEVHERQMALAEAKVRCDALVTRTHEELSIDLAERYAEYNHEEQNWEEVESEIGEIRAKMERLGNVNLDAINELTELEERLGFLTGQRDDLDDSNRQLTQLIDKLNCESRERFEASFTQIRNHFRTLFRRLFGGGKADIVLEDPEDVLESGIDIVAQPPGKDLLSISLMSGGEKSMTAIALLMSIFATRPAPFAILDEVDAALDEPNNERFNRIVREFVTNSQFIIITHSKWTMNTADRLYGITMQEPGVSTRVSVELATTNVA